MHTITGDTPNGPSHPLPEHHPGSAQAGQAPAPESAVHLPAVAPAQAAQAQTAEPQAQIGPTAGDTPGWGPIITAVFPDDGASPADLLYSEITVYPYDAQPNVYWSTTNMNFAGRGGYAGIQRSGNGGRNYNNICSVWDRVDLPPDVDPEVKLVYGIDGLYWDHFGGEGTGLHTSYVMNWLPGQRYALAVRRWTQGDEPYTYMAMFMLCLSTGRWTHYMSARVPERDVPLTGNMSGFLERYAGAALDYGGHYGNYFRLLSNGTWQAPSYYTVSAEGKKWMASLTWGYNGDDIRVVAGVPEQDVPPSITLRPSQLRAPSVLAAPTVVAMQIDYVQADDCIRVGWTLSDTSPPPLRTVIRLHDGNIYQAVIGQEVSMSPHSRQVMMNYDFNRARTGEFTVSVYFTDIFNQTSNLGYRAFQVS